jgi:glycerol-3-phosphate dehydrogenase subunit C
VLPPYSKTRFSTWLRARRSALIRPEQAQVAIFPTCLVEYSNPAVGHDLVKVYERNGVTCSLPDKLNCCGAPWLHSGEFDQFKNQAAHNVEILARAVRDGHDIVVPQPTCGYVLKRDYPEYLGTEDAQLVGEHTYDASEYLWRLHKGADTHLDTNFNGEVPETTAYHLPCHLKAQNIGFRSRDLLKLTGTQVKLVSECSGIDGMWGFRADNYELSRQVIKPLVKGIGAAEADVVVGDCHLANGAINQETGRVPQHPLQQLARAYGIPPEDQ